MDARVRKHAGSRCASEQRTFYTVTRPFEACPEQALRRRVPLPSMTFSLPLLHTSPICRYIDTGEAQQAPVIQTLKRLRKEALTPRVFEETNVGLMDSVEQPAFDIPKMMRLSSAPHGPKEDHGHKDEPHSRVEYQKSWANGSSQSDREATAVLVPLPCHSTPLLQSISLVEIEDFGDMSLSFSGSARETKFENNKSMQFESGKAKAI